MDLRGTKHHHEPRRNESLSCSCSGGECPEHHAAGADQPEPQLTPSGAMPIDR